MPLNIIDMNVILNCSNPDCETRDQIDREAEYLLWMQRCEVLQHNMPKSTLEEYTQKKMCNNMRERRIAGFKSNTYKLITKDGE